MEWNGQVLITKGGEYTAEPLVSRGDVTPLDYVNITVQVDGAPVEISALLIGGHYYVSVDGINALLGLNATEADGVLNIATK